MYKKREKEEKQPVAKSAEGRLSAQERCTQWFEMSIYIFTTHTTYLDKNKQVKKN